MAIEVKVRPMRQGGCWVAEARDTAYSLSTRAGCWRAVSLPVSHGEAKEVASDLGAVAVTLGQMLATLRREDPSAFRY